MCTLAYGRTICSVAACSQALNPHIVPHATSEEFPLRVEAKTIGRCPVRPWGIYLAFFQLGAAQRWTPVALHSNQQTLWTPCPHSGNLTACDSMLDQIMVQWTQCQVQQMAMVSML